MFCFDTFGSVIEIQMTDQDGSKRIKVDQRGSRWIKEDKSGSKGIKMDQRGSKQITVNCLDPL